MQMGRRMQKELWFSCEQKTLQAVDKSDFKAYTGHIKNY